jgi:hypothetical protein
MNHIKPFKNNALLSLYVSRRLHQNTEQENHARFKPRIITGFFMFKTLIRSLKINTSFYEM